MQKSTQVQHKGPYQGALTRQGNVNSDHDMCPHSDWPPTLRNSIGRTLCDTHHQVMHACIPPNGEGKVADVILVFVAAVEVHIG